MTRLRSINARSIRRRLLVAAGAATMLGGCRDFLDVNTNPNAPETVAPNLYLPPMLHWMFSGQQWDGRFIGRYTQMFYVPSTSLTTWDRMGYDPGSDNGGQQWRDVYWSFGQNLVDMMEIAQREERWDILGLGYILKAWGWQQLTNIHGEIIVKEAIDQTKFQFNYDTQEYAYTEVRRLLDSAIVYLKRTDGAVDATYMGRGDKVYNGDRAKWLKFAYGLRAINLSHYSNHPTYNPAAIIAAVDSSFSSNADDALLLYPGTVNDDRNFMGRTRGNFVDYRQTAFVVGLMDGTVFRVPDPRLTRMLAPSPDGLYRGLDPDVIGYGALTTTQRPNNPYGYPLAGGLNLPGLYLLDDKARYPAMTYAQLQFIKAEAAYRTDKPLALTAYRNGVSSHIDFVNARNAEAGLASQITAAQKAAFLADTAVVPLAANLTLTHIMSQKYIAQWFWAFNETWMDMRRYHYTDLDPSGTRKVYPGFDIPLTLYPDNGGKPVYRMRPRYFSEYVWSIPALTLIGGMEPSYHTKVPWIINPTATP